MSINQLIKLGFNYQSHALVGQLTHMGAMSFGVFGPVKGGREKVLHLKGIAGVFSSPLEARTATLRNIRKMERTIVLYVVSVL